MRKIVIGENGKEILELDADSKIDVFENIAKMSDSFETFAKNVSETFQMRGEMKDLFYRLILATCNLNGKKINWKNLQRIFKEFEWEFEEARVKSCAQKVCRNLSKYGYLVKRRELLRILVKYSNYGFKTRALKLECFPELPEFEKRITDYILKKSLTRREKISYILYTMDKSRMNPAMFKYALEFSTEFVMSNADNLKKFTEISKVSGKEFLRGQEAIYRILYSFRAVNRISSEISIERFLISLREIV